MFHHGHIHLITIGGTTDVSRPCRTVAAQDSPTGSAPLA
jgi:hypothetical protein